jgi:DNA-directed RNA polymerase subunit RPC12/RpoP
VFITAPSDPFSGKPVYLPRGPVSEYTLARPQFVRMRPTSQNGYSGLGFQGQPGALLHVKRGRVKEQTTTPHYVLCQDCSKEFTQILHIADLEKGGALCPHCSGKQVTQKLAAFSARYVQKEPL